jgi:hypothetical protein
MMRHFPRSTLSIAHLTGRVPQSAAEARLVTPPRLPQGPPSLGPGTILPAVDVPAITGPADLDLSMTARAVEEAISWLDHPHPANR